MQKKLPVAPLVLIIFLVLPALALSQAAEESRSFNVNGQIGRVRVVQLNGHSYVDLEALTRLANGSVTFSGDQITLTLPGTTTNPPATGDSSANSTANTGLSKSFLKAGIEAMSLVREWHSALANAIQNGFPITETWLLTYRNQAANGLRLASVAASTDSDRQTFQLLTSEFQNMKQLSDNYLAKREAVSYISPDSLANDALDQTIVSCAHSLASIAGSGQFVDDGSCQ
jgi:hypothetical protein